MTVIRPDNLAEFIETSDALGGPDSQKTKDYWATLSFELTEGLGSHPDPFSQEYFLEQIALYRLISGRDVDQYSNELAAFDTSYHVASSNPYGSLPPKESARHGINICAAITSAAPPSGGRALDMGCGWGLSSEILAYNGLNVTAVDINPNFVGLVNTRAAKSGLPIQCHHGSFDDFETAEKFDLVFFYECLHHALKPWEVLQRVSRFLTQDGVIALAGEPVNDFWWKSWGLRQDALSLYCIRKFGWFESGFSESFLADMFHKCGKLLRKSVNYGVPVYFSASPCFLDAELLRRLCPDPEWWTEGGYLVSKGGKSQIIPPFPIRTTGILVTLCNFKPADQKISLFVNDESAPAWTGSVPPGRQEIRVTFPVMVLTRLIFDSEGWRPSEVLNTSDDRQISFHLESVKFEQE